MTTDETVKKITGYIEALVNTPSPTGFTGRVTGMLADNAARKDIDYEITRKGAVLYKFETEDARKNVMLAVHVDTLGAIVKTVDDGKIKIDGIGGYPAEYAIGNYCTIHTFGGEELTGTILPENPSVHVNKDLKEKKIKLEDLVIRVDRKKKKGEEGYGDLIQVGNFVSFDPGFSFTNGYVKSRHLDDKASAGMLLHLADILNEKIKSGKFKTEKNLYFFFNITEETGQGIAGYPDIDDLLIVDMGAIGEGLSGDEYSVSICAKDATGPFNFEFTRELVEICRANDIPYKMDIFPYYGSDASGALRAGRDVRTALVGAGIDASHGYERTHMDSIEGVVRLLHRYIEEG